MLTIFTAPKPFRGHIDVIQRNAIGSWLQLGPEIEVLLIGEEEGIAHIAKEMNITHYPDVARNELGTPLVNSIFEIARREAHHPNLCYVNADILFLDDLLESVEQLSEHFRQYLIVGSRWDLRIDHRLEFQNGWVESLRQDITEFGRKHPPAGSDYFIFPRSAFAQIPPMAIGRAGWDNWMIYRGRADGIPVIDASEAITVVHQDHDYGHLPEGKPHYDLPESDRNVDLAGGEETVFTLGDANWSFSEGEVRRRGLKDFGLIREIEVAVILGFKPGRLSRILLAALHPWETLKYYIGASRRRLQRMAGTEN